VRRPSAIPFSARPVEPESPLAAETSVEPAWSGRERAAGSGNDAPRGSEADARRSGPGDENATAPILFDRRGADDPARTREGARERDDPERPDPPLTARDLWAATRARRRALRAEIRRFTQRSRRRRIGWIVGAALGLLIVGGSVGAAYSPLFAVQTITVEGAGAVKAVDVQKALSEQVGRPLALVDSSAVKAALVRFPLIETYRLEAHPPHDLVVRIVERTPVGVIQQTDGRFTVVDAAGVVLSTTDDRPGGYALIEVAGGTASPAFSAVGTALRTLPAALRGQVDSASASTPDDIVLQLGSGAKVVWGSAEKSAEKTIALQALMKASPGASSYDVSSPDVGIVG